MPTASDYLRFKHAAKSKAAKIRAKAVKNLNKKDKLSRGRTIDDCYSIATRSEYGDGHLLSNSLKGLFESFHHSYLHHLQPETEDNLAKSLELQAKLGHDHPGRPVHNGHYVRVLPQPLKNPKLILASEDACNMLGLEVEDVTTEEFIKYFSGDVKGAARSFRDVDLESWATPYALSIMGKRYTQDPFGGDGYGDGRAISVGEVLVPRPFDEDTVDPDVAETAAVAGKQYYPDYACRYELQLKGSGPTPFCRGGDGRTVLRSSIREFLASEAMYHLGVGTTRALCLIVSEGEKKRIFFGLKKKKKEGDLSLRPWYSDKQKAQSRTISTDDPRLAGYSEEDKKEIANQYNIRAKSEPDTVVEEKCAVTTRVCRSFIRVGHLDLFARRVETIKSSADGSDGVDVDNSTLVKETPQYKELEDFLWHACYREFYNEAYAPFIETKDAKGAAFALLEGSMKKISEMVAGWVRVGFVQGNFNADNCLVNGKTMDYGPFGFLDVYHPLASKWTAPSEHFGFMNQAKAGFANFTSLVESLRPVFEAHGGNVDEIEDEILARAEKCFALAVKKAISSKMGFDIGPPEMLKTADELWKDIEPLLRIARADWTLFWRQLTYVAVNYSQGSNGSESSVEGMLTMLLGNENTNPFYDTLTAENRAKLKSWLEKWNKALIVCHQFYLDQPSPKSFSPPCERMHLANPKYTLREWMLVDAYTQANGSKFVPGDYSLVHELHELSKDPYGEGSLESHKKFYRRAPDESLRTGGTAFMS